MASYPSTLLSSMLHQLWMDYFPVRDRLILPMSLASGDCVSAVQLGELSFNIHLIKIWLTAFHSTLGLSSSKWGTVLPNHKQRWWEGCHPAKSCGSKAIFLCLQTAKERSSPCLCPQRSCAFLMDNQTFLTPSVMYQTAWFCLLHAKGRISLAHVFASSFFSSE